MRARQAPWVFAPYCCLAALAASVIQVGLGSVLGYQVFSRALMVAYVVAMTVLWQKLPLFADDYHQMPG